MSSLIEKGSNSMKLNKSFAIPAMETVASVIMLGTHAVMERHWNFDKHGKLTNFLITGALSKDEKRIRRSIAAVLCAVGITTDLVSAIVYKIRDHKTRNQYDFDEICERAVDNSEAPDFVKEAYKAS